jgi:hypothetical protein
LKFVKEGIYNGKKGLLLWCNKITKCYNNNIEIEFNKSTFKNGRIFFQLIHQYIDINSHYLNNFIYLFDDSSLQFIENENLEFAFGFFEKYFDIPKLLDSNDFNNDKDNDKTISNEFSIILYLTMFWKKVNLDLEIDKKVIVYDNFIIFNNYFNINFIFLYEKK